MTINNASIAIGQRGMLILQIYGENSVCYYLMENLVFTAQYAIE